MCGKATSGGDVRVAPLDGKNRHPERKSAAVASYQQRTKRRTYEQRHVYIYPNLIRPNLGVRPIPLGGYHPWRHISNGRQGIPLAARWFAGQDPDLACSSRSRLSKLPLVSLYATWLPLDVCKSKHFAGKDSEFSPVLVLGFHHWAGRQQVAFL